LSQAREDKSYALSFQLATLQPLSCRKLVENCEPHTDFLFFAFLNDRDITKMQSQGESMRLAERTVLSSTRLFSGWVPLNRLEKYNSKRLHIEHSLTFIVARPSLILI